MSDIWIKTTNTGTTRWRKALSIKIKRFSSTWVAAKVIWIKNTSAGWLRVWPTSGVFAITDPYITSTASGTTPFYGNQTVGTNNVIRIGTTYYGRNGTWDPNGFTISSYNYAWPYYSELENQPGDYDLLGNLGTGVYASPSQALTISTPADATAVDGKYISFKITANASNSLYSNSADSKDTYGKIKVIRRTPINTSFAINGSATVGSVLSVASAWNTTEARKPDASRTIIKWYRSDSATAIYDGGGRTEIASGVYQYTLVQADSGKYIVAEETSFNTGSDYDIGVDQFTNGENQVTAVTSIITSAYRFAFGNHLYVSSNGHIGLDSGSSSYTSMSAGRNISIFVKDLEQYYLAEYSDTSVYYLYFKSYLLNSAAAANNALDYQIKFYNDTSINYCDVFVVRKGANVGSISDIAPGYYASGTTGYAGMVGPYVIGAGTVFRVYFGGTAATTNATTVNWTAVNDNLWDVIQTWPYPDGADDTFTDVTSATNQSAPFPVNTPGFPPTLTTDTGNFSAGSKITINTGTWTSTNSYAYELLWSTSTPILDTATNTKTLVDTNTYVITNADATAASYYFRGKVTGYANTGQTGNSAVAFTTTSSRSTLNPTSTISVGTLTSTGFTISGTASPLSGFGTTYANVSEIQIYNSSQNLISTITTGLPTVDGTAGTWSYVWTGGVAATTYYAKAVIKATDSAQTTFTTAFSAAATTSAALGISSVTYNGAGTITVNASGGGPYWQIYWSPNSTAPTSAYYDAASTTTTITDTLTPVTSSSYWFYVRSSTQNLGNTTSSGTATTGTYSSYAGPYIMRHITFDFNGGSDTNYSGFYADGTTNVVVPSPTARTGYTFAGWYSATTGGTLLIASTSTSYTISSTLTVYARWTPNTYAVTFYDNGGTGSPAAQTKTHGTNLTLSSTTPTRTNYAFNGWNTNSDGTGTNYAAGAIYTGNAALDLYAKWAALYTITFNSKSGTAVSAIEQSSAGGSIAKPTDPTRTDFTFDGWSTTDGGTTAVTWPRTPTANETLYAIWTAGLTITATASGTRGYNNFSITYDLTDDTKSVVIVYGTSTSYGTSVGTFTADGTSSPTGPLAANTLYYWRVTPYSNNNGTGTAGTAITGSTRTYTNPAHRGNTPASPTFQRFTSGTSSYIRYGWNNQSLLTPTGDYAEWGYEFRVYSDAALTTQLTGSPFFQAYNTTLDARLINGLERVYVFSGERSGTGYIGDFTWQSASVWGRYRPYYIPHGSSTRVFTGSVFSAAI